MFTQERLKELKRELVKGKNKGVRLDTVIDYDLALELVAQAYNAKKGGQ